MTSTPNSLKYATNVWLTSAILTPFFGGIFFSFVSDGLGNDFLIIVGLAIGTGLVCSIPNYLILLYFVWVIHSKNMTIIKKKTIINIISVLLTFALFLFFFQDEMNGDIMDLLGFPLAYSATLTFGIWFFNLNRQDSEELLEQQQLPKIKMLEDILDDEVY